MHCLRRRNMAGLDDTEIAAATNGMATFNIKRESEAQQKISTRKIMILCFGP